jgi:hypothetical protein
MQSKKCFTGLLKMAVSDDVQLGVQTRSSYDVKRFEVLTSVNTNCARKNSI